MQKGLQPQKIFITEIKKHDSILFHELIMQLYSESSAKLLHVILVAYEQPKSFMPFNLQKLASAY